MHQMRISTTFKSLFSDAQAEKVGKPKKKFVKTVKEPKTPQQRATKLSHIRGRIKLYMREIIHRFEMN
jgi:hypothetical protein